MSKLTPNLPIVPDRAAHIEAALRAVNGRPTKHCVTTYQEVETIVQLGQRHIEESGIGHLSSINVCYYRLGLDTERARYKSRSTVIGIRKTTSGWRLVHVSRGYVGQTVRSGMSIDADSAVLNLMRDVAKFDAVEGEPSFELSYALISRLNVSKRVAIGLSAGIALSKSPTDFVMLINEMVEAAGYTKNPTVSDALDNLMIAMRLAGRPTDEEDI